VCHIPGPLPKPQNDLDFAFSFLSSLDKPEVSGGAPNLYPAGIGVPPIGPEILTLDVLSPRDGVACSGAGGFAGDAGTVPSVGW
jgi:hypothetical protein